MNSVSPTLERPHPATAVILDHQIVAIKGDKKIRIEREYEGFPTAEDASPSWFVAATFDGTEGWGYQEVNRVAYTRGDGEIPILNTEGSGYFDLMRFYPCTIARGEGLHHRDLVNVLASDDTTLRPAMEMIDGNACDVVDVGTFPSGLPRETLWIDPARGYLPIIQHVYKKTGSGEETLLLELRIDSAIQLLDDVWVPGNATRKVFAATGEGNVVSQYLLTTAVNNDGRYAVRMNAGIADAQFDYASDLPPGTTVANLETGEQWIVSNLDYSAGADSALASSGTPTVARSRRAMRRHVCFIGEHAISETQQGRRGRSPRQSPA